MHLALFQLFCALLELLSVSDYICGPKSDTGNEYIAPLSWFWFSEFFTFIFVQLLFKSKVVAETTSGYGFGHSPHIIRLIAPSFLLESRSICKH